MPTALSAGAVTTPVVAIEPFGNIVTVLSLPVLAPLNSAKVSGPKYVLRPPLLNVPVWYAVAVGTPPVALMSHELSVPAMVFSPEIKRRAVWDLLPIHKPSEK